MDPKELVKLIEILNPQNKAGRITIITRMGAENMRVKLPHLIRAVRGAGLIVTWVSDPMHGNTMKAPCGLKTRSFDKILVLSTLFLFLSNLKPVGKNQCQSYSLHIPFLFSIVFSLNFVTVIGFFQLSFLFQLHAFTSVYQSVNYVYMLI